MKTLFISDLHLDEHQPDMVKLFLAFLKEKTLDADALYILGDFFEFWIGDDDPSPLANTIRTALREATDRGLPIYILIGNRDFLLGKKFLKATGCQFLPEEAVIHLYGTRTLLMHGDTLCTQDIAYLKARKYVRNWFVQKLFLMKSLTKRREIVSGYRKASQEYTQKTAKNIMDVTESEVVRVMQKHQVQHLIHGHTHRPAQHAFILNNQPAMRTVLDAWHHHGNVLICYDNHQQELVNFID